MSRLSSLMELVGHSFADVSLLRLSMAHPSRGKVNNQRLELLGDAVLEFCVTSELYFAHPKASEGELTKRRASLVNEQFLLGVAEKLGLEKQLKATPALHAETPGRAGMLADAVEALIAALYLDGGIACSAAFVKRFWQEAILSISRDEEYKNRLQELIQAEGRLQPYYVLLEESGPAHKRRFSVAVVDGDTQLATGHGCSKKQAEQAAAKAALEKLRRQDKP